MAAILRQAEPWVKDSFLSDPDPRSSQFPLLGSPVPVAAILIIYYMTVKKWGPELMKNRRPFQLDRIVQLYNILQALICGYIAYVGFSELYGPWGKHNFLCQPVNRETTNEEMRYVHLGYIYYLLKYIDFIDTIFFVLRKKHQQVTFLHLYHHIAMVATTYIGMRYAPGGSSSYLATINSLVHSVMYIYYFLSNAYKGSELVLRLKKHITQLQLVQFATLIIQYSGQLILYPNCKYPKGMTSLMLPQTMIILAMFIDFYWKKYIRTPASSKLLKKS